MTKSRRILRVLCWSTVLLMAVVTFTSGSYSILSPWSEINCEHQDIDLDTGRARFTRMLLWLPVRKEIRPTPISQALEITDLASPRGDWRRVNTFTPGSGISPHYHFHGALSDVHRLQAVWTIYQFSSDAQKESAATVLRLWKKSDRVSGASDYLTALENLRQEPVSSSDLSPANRSRLGMKGSNDNH